MKAKWNKELNVVYINESPNKVYKGLDMIIFNVKFIFLVFLCGKQHFESNAIWKKST